MGHARHTDLKTDGHGPHSRKVLHMTNDDGKLPPRVVLHRHGARRAYAVAVVLDEGPYSLHDAAQRAEALREEQGWVSKATAAQRLGLSERQVDYLRESGALLSASTETNHVLVSVESLNAEIERRSGE